MRNQSLWQEIHEFSLDIPEVDFCFSERLARENGWNLRYALRVIEEYKRFAYLAVVCEHEVTPSDQVDQAWHLHLLYTRNYWDGWCEVLGKPLHHGPTKGGKFERARYLTNYDATLASYRMEFDGDAPPEIWPGSKQRFSNGLQYQRVDMSDHIMVSKKSVVGAILAAIAFIVFLGIFLPTAGIATEHLANGGAGYSNTVVIIVLGLAFFGAFAGILYWSSSTKKKKSNGDSTHGNVGGCGSGDTGCSGGGGCGGGGG